MAEEAGSREMIVPVMLPFYPRESAGFAGCIALLSEEGKLRPLRFVISSEKQPVKR